MGGGTGGTSANGGTSASGGTKATGGATGMGGGNATGGTATGGGTSATAGSLGTGGATGGNTDRCDVGVYDPATAPTSYTISNGENVHDPTMILSNGTYYVFNSGVSLWTRTSTNQTSWGDIKQVFGGTNPGWIASYVSGVGNGDLWAPDVSYFGGLYHLYYAASTMESKSSCIGHASRAAMDSGAWSEDGGPVICSNVSAYSGTAVNWNAIDPNIILDETSRPWLVFGSGWDGIQIVRLTSSGALDSTSTITNIARRSAGVLEAAFMVRRCGYYYLFASWDKCCEGSSSTYNIRVGRSSSMTGGFVDKDGVALLSGGGTKLMGDGNGWVGPGGQSVLFNGTRAYLVYHAYVANVTTNSFALHISDLTWNNSGWPVTAASP